MKRTVTGDDIHEQLANGYTKWPWGDNDFLIVHGHDRVCGHVVAVDHKPEHHGSHSDCTGLDGELNQPCDQAVCLLRKGRFFLASEQLRGI